MIWSIFTHLLLLMHLLQYIFQFQILENLLLFTNLLTLLYWQYIFSYSTKSYCHTLSQYILYSTLLLILRMSLVKSHIWLTFSTISSLCWDILFICWYFLSYLFLLFFPIFYQVFYFLRSTCEQNPLYYLIYKKYKLFLAKLVEPKENEVVHGNNIQNDEGKFLIKNIYAKAVFNCDKYEPDFHTSGTWIKWKLEDKII